MTFQGLPLFGSVLAAAMALILWTLVVWVWMYATRLPAISKAKIPPQAARFPGSLDTLPDGVRQVANNYNHLMEQPTLFYATALALAASGRASAGAATLAWAYVGLRVAHSLVQATWNKIEVRFSLFFLSSLALLGLVAHAWVAVM
jgi:hypothetical protein